MALNIKLILSFLLVLVLAWMLIALPHLGNGKVKLHNRQSVLLIIMEWIKACSDQLASAGSGHDCYDSPFYNNLGTIARSSTVGGGTDTKYLASCYKLFSIIIL